MKKILLNLGMMAVMAIAITALSGSASAQGKHGGGHSNQSAHQRTWQTDRDGRDYGIGHKKDAHGYRNYGQYRRTQVGNRRSHMVRRYYYRDGERLSRMVRVHY